MKKTLIGKQCLMSAFMLWSIANANANDYPTNRGDLIGPTFRTDANVNGFVIQGVPPAADGAEATTYCAPRNSSFIVTNRGEDNTSVKFHGLGVPDKDSEAAYKLVCGDPPSKVIFDIVYTIPNDDFDAIPLRSSGVAYGALVVPFKFRLGSDKKISSSSTIAPYIGARWHRLQKWGVELMPIATAGLALVPVNDPITNDSSTKAAFSTALGVTLNSTTQKNFSAGILFGKDFLGNKDRALDPSVNKPWISIWIGTTQ